MGWVQGTRGPKPELGGLAMASQRKLHFIWVHGVSRSDSGEQKQGVQCSEMKECHLERPRVY